MKKNLKLAIFDMDGTILNTLLDLQISLNIALQASGFATRNIEEVRSFVGNGIPKLIERAVPKDSSKKEVQKVFAHFIAHYTEHCSDNTRPYDGIVDLFLALKKSGIKVAVCSNKADFAVKELCDTFFKNLVDVPLGVSDSTSPKPAPDMINAILQKLSIPISESVFVGDSDVDFLTAQNASLDCICVTWGFRQRADLEPLGASVFVDTAQELKALLLA